MNFWINLWTLFFFFSLALFAGLAVIVTIGGFFDIRSLFKSLMENRDDSPQKPVETSKKD
jgi:hypothetical protein